MPERVRSMEGLGTCSARCTARAENPSIDRDVDDDDHTGEDELDFPGETGRIDECQEVVLKETLGVARFASLDAKEVLGVGERADATRELDEKAPCGSRKVNRDEPAPARRECSAQKGEHDERQMQKQDDFGGKTVEHEPGGTMADALLKIDRRLSGGLDTPFCAGHCHRSSRSIC